MRARRPWPCSPGSGLAERLDHYPRQLSGGEQQRVAIARAFAGPPRLLFADEPTGNLDSATGEEIIDLMFDLNREHRTTLLLVTHDEKLATRCRRRLRLAAGRLVHGSADASGAARGASRAAAPRRDRAVVAARRGAVLAPAGARLACRGAARAGRRLWSIAVASLTTVAFFADRVNQALGQEASQLLAADLVVISDRPMAPALRTEAARAWAFRSVDTVRFPSMARRRRGHRADRDQGGRAGLPAEGAASRFASARKPRRSAARAASRSREPYGWMTGCWAGWDCNRRQHRPRRAQLFASPLR